MRAMWLRIYEADNKIPRGSNVLLRGIFYDMSCGEYVAIPHHLGLASLSEQHAAADSL